MDLKKYYSRKDIQKELLKISQNREVSVMFNDVFGKRPDILQFENDILELAKKGATSFHISEEHWTNPLSLKQGMTQKQLNDLRTGFDIILDIDGPFEFSTIAANLIIEALKFHDLKNISCKFSGNKGWHIGIPFKALPKKVNNQDIKDLFPETPKVIAFYLKKLIKELLHKKILEENTLENLEKKLNKTKEELSYKICKKCKKQADEKKIILYICNNCKSTEESYEEKYLECPQCKNKRDYEEKKIIICNACGNNDKKQFENGDFNPFSIVDIDTILISNRHMFRAPYSFHEKSGLISVPINSEEISKFKKEQAKIENVKVNIPFLDDSNVKEGEASTLVMQAFDYQNKKDDVKIKKEFFEVKNKIDSKYFPPCILFGLEKGLIDGKKRFLFILMNFLKSVGYSMEEINNIIKEWNKKNEQPLKEGYIQAQISWYKKQKENILPPNCSNLSYYKDTGICKPDNWCKFIKNPVNYTTRKLNVIKKNSD